jgi:threonine dehydrogenase-like Zn-dependent dehydrogenase
MSKVKSLKTKLNDRHEDIIEELIKLIGPVSESGSHVLNQEDFKNNLTIFLKHFLKSLQCELGSIYTVEPNKNELRGFVTFGYTKDISDIKYELGDVNKKGKDLFKRNNNEKGKGITAFVATTGEVLWFDRRKLPSSHPAHAGRIDQRQWIHNRVFKNCGIIPLKVGNEIIGVVKLENFQAESPNYIISVDKKDLSLKIVRLIALAMDNHRRRLMKGDQIYRITINKPEQFEKVALGQVALKHVLTSICKSDYAYFTHKKSKEKLAERLPLVLGHETVAIIHELSYEQHYTDKNQNGINEFIQVGDRVVVIPQIPCENCPTCKASDGTVNTYGENYCENVKHMASNAEGSLRTRYRYWSDLLIKIPNEIENELAVLTEPIAQLVQVWRELGFDDQRKEEIELNLIKFKEIVLDNAFNIEADKFDDYFKIFAHDQQTPRTALRLIFDKFNKSEPIIRSFSHYRLMRRGLFLTALAKNINIIKKQNPKILILGTGPFAYFAAVLITQAYGIKKENLYVYGRRDASLAHFELFANKINIEYPSINNTSYGYSKTNESDETQKLKLCQNSITKALKSNNIEFDIILECIGGESTGNLIEFSLNNIADQGIIALFGLSDDSIDVDFNKVMSKQVTFKGFFRACRQSYLDVITHLKNPEFAKLISHVVENHCPPISIIQEKDLDKAFFISNSKEEKSWGKVLVSLAE